MKRAIRYLVAFVPWLALGQVTPADYQRAQTLREKLQPLAIDIPGRVTWIDKTGRFWYRKSVRGGHEFMLVDANTQTKKPAFDQTRLAASLSAAAGTTVAPLELPFTEIQFVDGERALRFSVFGSDWQCGLADYVCARLGRTRSPAGAGNRAPWSDHDEDDVHTEFANNVHDGIADVSPQGRTTPPMDAARPQTAEPKPSPDGQWVALIQNFNCLPSAQRSISAVGVEH